MRIPMRISIQGPENFISSPVLFIHSVQKLFYEVIRLKLVFIVAQFFFMAESKIQWAGKFII